MKERRLGQCEETLAIRLAQAGVEIAECLLWKAAKCLIDVET